MSSGGNRQRHGMVRKTTLILGLVLGVTSFVSAGQRAILKGGSREVIPLKEGQSPVEAIEEYRKKQSISGLRDTDVRSVQEIDADYDATLRDGEEYELRWRDWDCTVNFGFSTCEPTPCSGDSIAQWMVPLARATVKKILLSVVNFEGTIELALYESNYNGEVTTDGCVDDFGWVGLYENGEWT